MKYIDAEKLKAEIERLTNQKKEQLKRFSDEDYSCSVASSINCELKGNEEVLPLIDSLQQEQPDFPTTDKEIERFLATHPKVEVPDKYKNPDWLWKKQEQSDGLHFISLNRLIQKIPSENWNDTVNNYARKLRDCLIREGYRKDAELLQGYISYMNGNNVPMATMDEQEQPEPSNNLVDVDAVREDFVTEVYRVLDADPTNDRANAIINAFDSLPTVSQEWPKVDLEKEISYIYCRKYKHGMSFSDVAHHFYELGRLNARKEEDK